MSSGLIGHLSSIRRRNRCFRCLFCQKAPAPDGRIGGGPFVLTHRWTRRLVDMSDEQQWWNCLICNVSPSARLLTFGPEERARCCALLEPAETPRRLAGAPCGASPFSARTAMSAHTLTSPLQHQRLGKFTVCTDSRLLPSALKYQHPFHAKVTMVGRLRPDCDAVRGCYD